MPTMSDFSDFVPAHIQALKPYQPGRPVEEVERDFKLKGVIKLASNENPLGPSPKAMAAAEEALQRVHLYPDGAAFHLRSELAERHGIDPTRFVFGAGCDEIIHFIVRAFCTPGVDEVLSHDYAFISYRIAAMAHGVRFVSAPVDELLRCEVDALIERMSEKTRVIFIANPNNPTGAHWSRRDIERVLESAPVDAIIVLDEAYHEYAKFALDDYPSSFEYAENFPRLVTLRTFSKIYGLAGLRVGYGICQSDVASFINRVRGPFNVNSVAQASALAALSDTAHVQASAESAKRGIQRFQDAIAKLGGRAFASAANFVLLDVAKPGPQVCEDLLREGIIVRPMDSWGLKTHIRVSIGSDQEVERAIEALATVLST